MAKPKVQDIVQFVSVQQPLTVAAARQLATDYPHRIYLTLHESWESTAALDALMQAVGQRLETLYLLKPGKGFWPWLQGDPPLREVILPGSMIPTQWPQAYDAPTESLWFHHIPKSRTTLDLSGFRKVRKVHLESPGHITLHLSGKVTSLSLDHLTVTPDDSWASLQELRIESAKLDLAPLLAACPHLDTLQLAWPFRLDNLETLLRSRHWDKIDILGNPGMPTDLIDRLWEARIANKIDCRHFPGPFQEEVFTNGKWEAYCTR
ncbi:MAG: hypothetical protein JNK87_02475 [Bryobacterales bacterium]|nr:hypothetical protein [Bryobacterales bacterium]